MTVLDIGLNKTAEKVAAVIEKGQWGDGTSLTNVTDTGLGSPIASTKLDLSSAVSSGNSATFQHDVNSVTANGETFSEFGLIFDDDVFFNRSLNASFNKTNSYDVTSLTTVSFIRG